LRMAGFEIFEKKLLVQDADGGLNKRKDQRAVG